MAQQDLFQDQAEEKKSDLLMQVLDAINTRMGKQALVTASQGFVYPRNGS